jgi:glycosyltransferase involved in cell wall biosynthesis
MVELSVVTPTFNRLTRLGRVLAALERQTIPADRFEVIVVNDGSSDGTEAWLARHRAPFQLRCITTTNGGPARARNTGIEAATGELVVFVDDDVEPSTVLLEEHLRSHREAGNLVVMGPLQSLPHYAQPWIAWEQANLEKQYTAMTRGDWPPSFRQFWTGNASVARRHLLAAGLFDPSYLRAEDIELGIRLRDLGMSFRFNPRAGGLHYAERSLSSWEHAFASYGKNDVSIFAKLGEAEMLEILSASWRHLNPINRWLITRCLTRPLRRKAACAVLRNQLRLAERVPLPPAVSQRVCSLLAGLNYWPACASALGPERAARVLGLALSQEVAARTA